MTRFPGGRAVCARCGEKLSLPERLLGRLLCRNCAGDDATDQKRRRSVFLGAVTALDLHGDIGPAQIGVLQSTTPDSVGVEWHHSMASGAIRFLLEQAATDGQLTVQEDRRVEEAARLLRVDLRELLHAHPDLDAQATIARSNAGTLPLLERAPLRLLPGEVCHMEVNAAILPDELVMAATGRGAHDAYRVQHGSPMSTDVVTMRLPFLRGGQKAEAGRMIITDQRLVFRSRRRSVQASYARLLGFVIYGDGIRIRMAGKRRSRTFRVANPIIVAAVANGAAMKVRPATVSGNASRPPSADAGAGVPVPAGSR